MAKIKVKEPKPTPEEKLYLNSALKLLFENCYDLKSIVSIRDAFHALPLRSYTDYYKIIKKPQSLHKISQLIKGNRYSNAQEFVVDLTQITWNARFYNEIGSPYYETAVVLDNYVKDVVIPALKSDPKIFGGSRVDYPYLGPLPGEEPVTFESLNDYNNTGNNNNSNNNNNEGSGNSNANQYETEDERDYNEVSEEPQSIQQEDKGWDTMYQDTGSMQQPLRTLQQLQEQEQQLQLQHQQQQQQDMQIQQQQLLKLQQQPYEPIPSFSTLGIPASVFKDYEPIPVEEVPTLDQNTSMTPKPSPIVLNTTTAKAPHPNQREVFETWNKRGKPPVIDKPHEQRIKNIMRIMKKQRSSRGEPLYLPFERLPNQQTNPQYYRKVVNPMCLEFIRTKIKQRKYPDVESYLTDLFLVIENNKLYASQVSDAKLLNDVIEFETVCKRLISEELAKPDTVYLTSDAHGMRIPIDLLELNGRKYKIGDWVLLRNPNDETKPIPAQIFRIWSTPEDGNKRYINVCWYYRPEQTVHRVDRLFYENEVFKTGQYRDHLVQDILGPCYVNYFTRYQRGEPAFKVYGPMFVCEFRYSDHDKNFNKIRTWKACIPDEVREIDDPIIPLPNGGLRWFQKYTSPLMHLLPPNATINDPIPEPIIASLNAPPLIGGVYKRGPLLDDDLGQYLSSPARNLVVRKTITLLNNIGTRNDAPMPTQLQMLAAQLLQQLQQNGSHNGSTHTRQFTPLLNYVPQVSLISQHSSPSQSSPLLQQVVHSLVAESPLTAYLPHDFNAGYQSASKYYKNINPNKNMIHNNNNNNNNNTHYNQAFTGKIVPSPYNQVIHTISNFHQSTSARTFIIPNRLQKKLDDNVELANIFSNTMDLVNKDRLMKYSPSYMITELQQYDLLNKLKEPSLMPKGMKRKLVVNEQHYSSDGSDDDDEENEDDDNDGVQTMHNEQDQQPISQKTPSLWFRGAPMYIKNRIVNDSVYGSGNKHIIRFSKGNTAKRVKQMATPPSSDDSLAKAEVSDIHPLLLILPSNEVNEGENVVASEVLGEQQQQQQQTIPVDDGEETDEEEDEHANDEEIELPADGMCGFGTLGRSVEYLAFKLKQKASLV